VLAILTACGPVSTPIAEPTPPQPVLWRVQLTPSLGWLRPLMNACTRQQPGVSLLAFEMPPAEIDPANADFSLLWQNPPEAGEAAFQLAEDELVFIVHPSNSLAELNLDALRQLYARQATWADLGVPEAGEAAQVEPYTYAAQAEPAQILAQAGLNLASAGQHTRLVPHPPAMLESVAGSPNAIGYIPRKWLNESVRVLPVSDIEAQALRRPVVALLPQPPGPSQTEWLLCIQTALNGN